MRYAAVAMVTCGVVLTVWMSTSAQESLSRVAQQKGWYTSYEQARAAARQTGKPMLVIFRCEP